MKYRISLLRNYRNCAGKPLASQSTPDPRYTAKEPESSSLRTQGNEFGRKISPARGGQPDQAARPARPVRGERLLAGLARQPLPRLLRRVQRAPQIHRG